MDFSADQVASVVFFLVSILFSLSVHESAHAWMADRLGDPTARMMGRVTLNPLKHIDPIGTVILPIILVLIHAPVFGWAKPVPTVPRNFKNIKRDQALVAAAGPVSNLLIALCTTIVLILLEITMGPAKFFELLNTDNSPINLILLFAFLNLILAFFNLIPIPPLDGSWILEGVLPDSAQGFLAILRQYGFIILIILIFSGGIRYILIPISYLLLKVFVLTPLYLLANMLS